jgi:hypothetical protein
MIDVKLRAEFEAWWAQYPLKRGKIAAEKKYHAARRRGATQQELLSGLAAYVQHKPSWQEWAFPQTWLHQGRWSDDYSKPVPEHAPVKRVPEAYRPYIRLADRGN